MPPASMLLLVGMGCGMSHGSGCVIGGGKTSGEEGGERCFIQAGAEKKRQCFGGVVGWEGGMGWGVSDSGGGGEGGELLGAYPKYAPVREGRWNSLPATTTSPPTLPSLPHSPDDYYLDSGGGGGGSLLLILILG